jgi:hypothetical protein
MTRTTQWKCMYHLQRGDNDDETRDDNDEGEMTITMRGDDDDNEGVDNEPDNHGGE